MRTKSATTVCLSLVGLAILSTIYGCNQRGLIDSVDERVIQEAPQKAVSRKVPNTRAIREQKALIRQLRPLHKKPGPPQPGDWLDRHKEPGQTFDEYLQQSPVKPTGRRSVLYIQPLGPFDQNERKVLKLTAEFMGIYLNGPVKTLDDLPLSVIPDEAQRIHPQWKVRQILTSYVLNDVLKPKLPRDAAACLALTTIDLWPGRGWNFVFGQASLRDRVGVWSLNRNGDLSAGPEAYRLFLRRTLKTATHETGHMFSIKHCTAFECNMNGSNSRAESDRQPLYLCPECHAKVCWATGAKPSERYQRLADFCRRHELQDESVYYDRVLAALKISESESE